MATCALATLISTATTPARAERPACELLEKHLRWHEPFFGLQTWNEAAAEALAHAPAACREAVAAGKAPEINAALSNLWQHADSGGPPLRRFVYRLSCRLRAPEARRRILDGIYEAAVYADCADALFTMQWTDREALRLREQYLDGLRHEPLTTHVPRGALQPPYIEKLVPVLRAYDDAQWVGRDTLYRAICTQGAEISAETRALCAGLKEREPDWIKQKLFDGSVDAGISHLATLPPDKLPQLAATLVQFDVEKRAGRDRLYGMLCSRHAPIDPSLRKVCGELKPYEEGRWVALSKRAKVDEQIALYMFGGRMFAGFLLLMSLIFFAHRLFSGHKRSLPLDVEG